jgi:hypothetical protein
MALDRLIETTRPTAPPPPLRPLRSLSQAARLAAEAPPAVAAGPIARAKAGFVLEEPLVHMIEWVNLAVVEPVELSIRRLAVSLDGLALALATVEHLAEEPAEELTVEEPATPGNSEARLSEAVTAAEPVVEPPQVLEPEAAEPPPLPVPLRAGTVPCRATVGAVRRDPVAHTPRPAAMAVEPLWTEALTGALGFEPLSRPASADPLDTALAAGVFSGPLPPAIAAVLELPEGLRSATESATVQSSETDPHEVPAVVPLRPATVEQLRPGIPKREPVVMPEPAGPVAALPPAAARSDLPVLLEIPPLEFEAIRVHSPRLNGMTLRPRLHFAAPPAKAPASNGPQLAAVRPTAVPTAEAKSLPYRGSRGLESGPVIRKANPKRRPEVVPQPEPAGAPAIAAEEQPNLGAADPGSDGDAPKFAVLGDEPSLRGRLIRSLSLWMKTGSAVLLLGAVLAGSGALVTGDRPGEPGWREEIGKQ